MNRFLKGIRVNVSHFKLTIKTLNCFENSVATKLVYLKETVNRQVYRKPTSNKWFTR